MLAACFGIRAPTCLGGGHFLASLYIIYSQKYFMAVFFHSCLE